MCVKLKIEIECPKCGTKFVRDTSETGEVVVSLNGPPRQKRRFVAKCPGKIEDKDCGTMIEVEV